MTLALSQSEILARHLEAARQRIDAGEPAAAIESLETAAAIAPTSSETHFLLALAHRRMDRREAAERYARLATELDPGNPRAAHFFGALLAEAGRYEEAAPWLRRAVQLAPNAAQHQRDLGVMELFLGDVEAARRALLIAAERDPLADKALYTLARITPMGAGAADARRVQALLDAALARFGELPPRIRAQLCYARFKALEDAGATDEAFAALSEGAALHRAALDVDVSKTEDLVERIIRVFDAPLVRRLADHGSPSPRPILVCGMPRSGTTLVEQILAAHPLVHGGGETTALMQMVGSIRGNDGSSYPEWAAMLNAADCRLVADGYLAALPTGPGKVRTTDKRLENTYFLGLAAGVLPNATLIACRRDPRDVAFSCYALMFTDGQEWSYDFDEIARYWRAHERLMAHWRAVLPPGRLLEVDYEGVVADLDPWARRIVAHAGLDWDPACLAFHQAKRAVTSASMAQVREPIYDRSVGRWRPFAAHLRPLFEAMGLEGG